MASKYPPLPLTDENQRLVNLYLLQAVQSFKPKGMLGIFSALDSSLKKDKENEKDEENEKDGSLTYDGMKKAIERDFEDLTNLAGKPDKLKYWLKTRKKSRMLQVRITKHQFLLNNILNLLNLQFEDLFDRDKLPGIAETHANTDNSAIIDDDAQETYKILQEINSKLDKVIFQQEGDRIYKTYAQRCSDLLIYMNCIQGYIFNMYHEPDKSGLSFRKEEITKLEDKAIYGKSYSYIKLFLSKMNKRTLITKLFQYFRSSQNNDFIIGRLLNPWFFIGILIQFLIDLTKSAIRNKINLFYLLNQKTATDDILLEFNSIYYENNKFLEKLKRPQKETHRIIQYIIKHEIKPNESICISYEKLFVNFFKNTQNLFQNMVSDVHNIDKIIMEINFRKEMETKINETLNPNYIIKFNIEENQLNYLDEYIDEIDYVRKDLRNYYAGNVDTDRT